MKLAQANQLIDWWTLDTKPAVEHSYRSAFIMSTFGGLVTSGAFHPAHLWPLLFIGIGLLFKLNEEGTTSERSFRKSHIWIFVSTLYFHLFRRRNRLLGLVRGILFADALLFGLELY